MCALVRFIQFLAIYVLFKAIRSLNNKTTGSQENLQIEIEHLRDRKYGLIMS